MSALFDIVPFPSPEVGGQSYIPWPVVAGAVVFVGLGAFLIARAVMKQGAAKEEAKP